MIGKIHRPGRDQDVEQWAGLSVTDKTVDKQAVNRLRAGGYFIEYPRTRMFALRSKHLRMRQLLWKISVFPTSWAS